MYSHANKRNNDRIPGKFPLVSRKKYESVVTGKIQLSHKGNISCVLWEILFCTTINVPVV